MKRNSHLHILQDMSTHFKNFWVDFFFFCSLCDRNAINTLLTNSTQNHCFNEVGAQVLGEVGGKNDPFNARGPTLLDIRLLTLFLSWGLHCAPYDTVTSSHGEVLIARHFPLASVNSHSDRGLGVVGRGGELSGGLSGGRKSLLQLFGTFFQDHVLLSPKVTTDLRHVNRNSIKNFFSFLFFCFNKG